MIYIFMADGFEETELTAPADILIRAGHEVKLVSVNGDMTVAGAHGIRYAADLAFDDCDFSDSELLILPGGMPGTANLQEHEGLKKLLTETHAAGGRIAAICAAPSVLGAYGICEGKSVTCYPGFEDKLTGAAKAGGFKVVTDGNITTSKGPGTALDFGLELVKVLDGEALADGIRSDIQYDR